jgi:ribosomal-protein-alanine acetyltransferase
MAMTAVRRIAIRPMTPADLRQVRRIERAAYGASTPGTPFERELANGLAQYLVAVDRSGASAAGSTQHEPGHEPAVFDRLRQWSASSLPRLRDRVGVGSPVRRLLGGGGSSERIVGFIGVWYTVDQLHIVTVAVDPPAQHQGIAQRLLLEAYRLANESELRSIALEVRASNDRARRLYEAFGFHRAGTLRTYYSDNQEDAIVMVTAELDAPDTIALIARLRDDHARRYGSSFTPL